MNIKLRSSTTVLLATLFLNRLVQGVKHVKHVNGTQKLTSPGARPLRGGPKAKEVFQYWTGKNISEAVPLDYELVLKTRERKVRTRSLQTKVADGDWNSGGTVNVAVGRLLFTRSGSNFRCSGTVINDNGVVGRSLIATAAHCVYDDAKKVFSTNFLFIPHQDDGGTDKSDKDCMNDKFGCWAPKFAVIDARWNSVSWPTNGKYDYAVLVVPDSGAHSRGRENTNPVLDSAVTPMQVDFHNSQKLGSGSLGLFHGYSAVKDPNFRYCLQSLSSKTDFWEFPGCMLSGGASGGPGQPYTNGNGKLFTIVSYGYSSNGVQKGMGGPRLNSNSFSCLYQRARTTSATVMVSYSGTPCAV